jgi:hypothetical protein
VLKTQTRFWLDVGRPQVQPVPPALLISSKTFCPTFAFETDRGSIILVHDQTGSRPSLRTQIDDHVGNVIQLEDFLQRDIPQVKIMSFSPSTNSLEALFTAKGLNAVATELLDSICEESETNQVSTFARGASGCVNLILSAREAPHHIHWLWRRRSHH